MCQRCIDARVHCPGPISSAFIFVASGSEANRKNAREQHAQAGSPATARGLPSPPLTVSLPPTPTSAILLDTFLRYLSHSARFSSWTFALPSLSASGTPLTHPLTSALHAVSLAHFANISSDPVFSHHATLEYSRTLSLQRLSLAILPAPILTHVSRKPQILEAVRYALLTSTILSYYELIAATTPSAWSTHTQACEQLLGLIGPAIVGEDRILRQLSVSVRCHAVIRVTVYDHATVFTEAVWLDSIRKWTTAQQQSVSRDAYDWVIEFMLRVSRYGQSRPPKQRSGYQTAVAPDDPQAEESPAKFLKELQSNYADWMMAMSPPSSPSSASSLPLFGTLPLPQAPPNTPVQPLPPPLQIQFPSMAFAHFHAAAILLMALPQFQRPHPGDPSSTSAARQPYDFDSGYDPAWNCQWIASACAFLQLSSCTNATAVLRMGLPFAVAWRFCYRNSTRTSTRTSSGENVNSDISGNSSSSSNSMADSTAGEHQDEDELRLRQLKMNMRAMFEDWAAREGMRGLAVVGFPPSGAEREPE